MGSYRSGYRRRSHAPAGRVAKPNRRPGACHYCGEEVPAFGGQLYREPDGSWSAAHVEASQGGWLMHPEPYRGGCPEETDRRNAELHASGFLGPDAPVPASERARIAARARVEAVRAENRQPGPRGSKYAYTSSGARMTMSSRRCEDAPCCGCCD